MIISTKKEPRKETLLLKVKQVVLSSDKDSIMPVDLNESVENSG